MADVEKNPKLEKGKSPVPGRSDDVRKGPPTVGFVTEFFAQLKLNKAMKDVSRGSAKMSNLLLIEEDLASDNIRVKEEAIRKIDELKGVRQKSEAKVEKLNAGQLVANVEVSPALRERVEQIAATIDKGFEKIQAGHVSQAELNSLNEQLELLAVGLEVEVEAGAMEGLTSKLKQLELVVKTRELVETNRDQVSALNLYKDEFDIGDKGDILKVRGVEAEKKSSIQTRLEKYKEQVRKELLGRDKKVLEELTPDELLKRLEEATYWRENKKYLFGDSKSGKHRGYAEMEKLEDVLIGVEAQYTVAFEKKMEQGLAKNGVSGEYVRLATQKVLKGKKPFGRSKYDFEKGNPKGRSAFEAMKAEVDDVSKKMEKGTAKKSKVVMSSREGTVSGSIEHGGAKFNSVEEAEAGLNQQREFKKRIDRLGVKLGIKIDDNLRASLEDPGKREELEELARIKGLTPMEMAEFNDVLTVFEGGGRFKGIQAELVKLSKEAKSTGNYSKYMIKLQAYIDRVGLRETSSDFQFAIVMREAKDEISQINSDAGGKFDLWQEAQFLPSITSLDEKTFYSISPKVMNQLRAKMELEGPMANWLAMQVESPKDGKKALSVASFYQMLQRRDVANRVIAAPINSNDSTIMQLWAEHVWGDGASLVMREDNPNLLSHIHLDDGTPKGRDIFDIDINYFSMDSNPKIDAKSGEKKVSITKFMDQSMWMAHYAEKMWWYSGEWEAFARDFPGERLPQANKRLLAIGAAFRDYGIEYGKFDVGYVELAKAGVLLQDFRTYKANDVIVANMRHMLFDTKNPDGSPIAIAKEGEALGRGIFKALSVSAKISDEYSPLSSLRSVEEIRVMGNLGAYSTPEARWNYYKKLQEKMGRKGVPSYSKIAEIRNKSFENLRGDDEGWFVQAEQVDIMFDDLTKQRAELGELNWTPGVLHQLMDKQSFIETGSHRERGGESLDEFLKNFQYSAVLSYSELRKGTDPLDYQKYSEAKMDAAALMTEVLNGTPTLEKLNELFVKMRSYMPPDQVVAWFGEFRKKQIQLRTFQTVKYDIAMTDLEEWTMKKKRGEITEDKPPSLVIGYNPAVFSLKDERGDKWNITGADGFKVTRKKKTWGNHMKSTRDIPALTASEIEMQNKIYVGNRWLMKKKAEEILEDSFGFSQYINKFYKSRGLDPYSKGAMRLKKYTAKAWLILRQHPLFDDPKWAFWSILNEYVEFGKEVSKEMQKQVIGGH